MIKKDEEEEIKNKRNKRKTEMILNYPLKIERWILIIKKYIKLNIILGKEKKRKVLKIFVFF